MRQTLLLMLVTLVLAAPAAAHSSPKPKHAKHTRVTHSGTLVSRTAASVTVKRGDHTLTCSRNDASPNVKSSDVGHKVKVTCDNGVLVSLQSSFRGSAAGSITALSPTSISLHNDDATVTCTLGDGSPKLVDYHVGDRVKLSCSDGVLTAIAKIDPPKITETTITTGTLSVLTPTSVSVLSDGGPRTCTRGDGSPSLDGYNVGDRVKMTCTNGLLTVMAKADLITDGSGVLTALTPTSFTVHTDGGDKSCSRGTASPSMDGYQLGDLVKFYCTNGVLTAIAKVSATVTATATGMLSALSPTSLTVR